MTLRSKILLTVGATFLVGAVVTNFVASDYLMQRFTSLENEMVQVNLVRVQEALYSDYGHLNTTGGDWGPWDDTKDFVLGESPEYVDENLTPSVLSNLNVNFIIILDLDLNLVYATEVNLDDETTVSVDSELIEYLKTLNVYSDAIESDYFKAGLVTAPGGLCEMSIWPITENDFIPPKFGYFILGRYLTDKEIELLSDRTKLDVQLFLLDDLTEGSRDALALEYLNQYSTPYIEPVSDEVVLGYEILNDIEDNPSVLLRISMPRDFHLYGQTTIQYFLGILSAIGILVLLTLLLTIEWVILRPQRILINEITILAEIRDLKQRLPNISVDELGKLSTAVNTLLAALEEAVKQRQSIEAQIKEAQKTESLKVFAGSIAHNFNNTLTTVLGNFELLKSTELDPTERDACLREAESAAQLAAEMSSLMLTYVGQGKDIIQAVDINALIKKEIKLFKGTLPSNVTLEFMSREIPCTAGDAGQIQQVIINLLTNAIEALEENQGTITVRTDYESFNLSDLQEFNGSFQHGDGEYLVIEVADSGQGMDQEILSRAFDPFYTTKFMGRGLGLAAVLGILRGHNGGIRLSSVPGEGTTATVLLPKIECSESSSIPEKTETEATPTTGESAAVPSKEICLLLADDEDSVRSVGANLLKRAGFKVYTAADGIEAVDAYREHGEEIDCVLLDLSMPRMDGVNTFSALREMDESVRVLIVTGFGEEDINTNFTGDNFCGVVQKPYRLAEIVKRIKMAVAS